MQNDYCRRSDRSMALNLITVAMSYILQKAKLQTLYNSSVYMVYVDMLMLSPVNQWGALGILFLSIVSSRHLAI